MDERQGRELDARHNMFLMSMKTTRQVDGGEDKKLLYVRKSATVVYFVSVVTRSTAMVLLPPRTNYCILQFILYLRLVSSSFNARGKRNVR